jgi:hypothetical protein
MSREIPHTRRCPRRERLRWALVALLAAGAGALVALLAMPLPAATAQVVTGERGDEVLVVAGQVSQDTYGLYLVDTERDTICVYEYFPGRGSSPAQLRLTAARRFSFDLQLEDYNTQPSPREIKELVEQHRRLEETSPGP